MVAPSKNFTVQPDSQVDANSPLDETLLTQQRDNDIHMEEWLGKNYTAAVDHDHDGVNSKSVSGAAVGSINETHIDWLLSDGMTQMSMYPSIKGGELSHVGATDGTAYISWVTNYIHVPDNANNLKVGFLLKKTNTSNTAYARVVIGGVTLSNVITQGNSVYVLYEVTVDVSSYVGATLFDFQMYCSNSASGRSAEAKSIYCRFI